MSFTVGSLVRVRGREWVVLPESTEELVRVRPLGGTDDEVTGIYTLLENVEPAQFALPDPTQIGDYRSARLLRAAVRLGFRSSAGPFRSFARINVEPRPYQLVPLLMALKQDPVRLLIADDVGIGKTIEALLVARELLDRGEINRLAVLCPPQLAEQWHAELHEKFYIEAELVLSSTATRLERHLRMGESLFERHPFVVVSTDFIKSERRRDEFLRTAPNFIIVDEAHAVAHTVDKRGGRHQRHELVAQLAEKPERHLVLVTATPHSGKEEAFRSLVAMLNPDFKNLPEDLTGEKNEPLRRELARYFVQRRRGDIRAYLDTVTPFPERDTTEETYKLTDAYKHLFDRVLNYARETVRQPGESYRQRVRWWSALALLRSLASSPAAAAATLRSRAATTEADNEADVDDIGRRTVLDLITNDSAEVIDVIPGSDASELEELEADADKHRRRLLEMARAADALHGEADSKLQRLIAIVKDLLREGYNPIVFCRFIPTVEYVTDALRQATRGVEVAGVTGTLPPAEREERVRQLSQAAKRVLVCTDCLSEGINLQQAFDAVVHYDLSWNPTRHEQREGRVDRYGQPSPRVRVVTYYGIDNQIDGIVLDVLLRKHKTIRNSLGISVPVPGNSEDVAEAIFEGLLLRENVSFTQNYLPGFDAFMKPHQAELDLQWEAAAEREKRSRTMFAQQAIRVDEVAAELRAAREAVGSGVDVAAFVKDVLTMQGGIISLLPQGEGLEMKADLKEAPRGLKDMLGKERFVARFELPVKERQLYLTRTHPLVESLAAYVMNTALDTAEPGDPLPRARRAGAIRTTAVERRTTLLLVRLRYHLITRNGSEERQLLAEDSLTLAFEGAPDNAVWLEPEAAERLLQAEPDENIHPQQAAEFVGRVVDGFDHIAPTLNDIAQRRGDDLLAAHVRVREAAYRRGDRRPQHRVEAQLPPDVLGIYVFLPALGRK
jgi:superfamily II DNA or RNA helicase